MMDILISPTKLRLINQSSPRHSERKRSLFPTNSPQTKDGIGRFSPLNYSPEMYSPPLPSPTWSVTPTKDDKENNYKSPTTKIKLDKLLKKKDQMDFLSPEKYLKKSLHNSRKALSEKNIFKYFEKLPGSPEKEHTEIVPKIFENPNKVQQQQTPKAKINIRRNSPTNKELKPVALSPRTFYGNSATNQSNYIQGIKRAFRPLPVESKAKVKLFSEEKKKSTKRARSKSSEPLTRSKRKKELYPGVYHSIKKPKPKVPAKENHVAFLPKLKVDSFRERIKRAYDFSHTPYAIKKKKVDGFYNSAKFIKPQRIEMENVDSRKFFKSTVAPRIQSIPTTALKKRKLLDPNWDLEDNNVKITANDIINPSDILDMIEDGIIEEVENEKDQKGVSEILLHLTEDEEDESLEQLLHEMSVGFEGENLNEQQEKMLKESPDGSVNRLASSTAILAINENANDFIPSFNQNKGSNETFSTPHRYFPIFDSSVSSSPASSDEFKKKKEKAQWHPQDENQMQIDAGQKNFGPTHCPECGLVYQIGEPDDEIQHNLYHSNYHTLRHAGWKNEMIVFNYQQDRIIMVGPTDLKSKQNKLEDVLKVVDKELGFYSNTPLPSLNYKAFLYICEKTIVGLLLAVPLSTAYKMIPCENDIDICSKETYPVKCGVSRIWTHSAYRRQGIAARMMDTLRRNFMYGHIMSREEIAFSVPSTDGKKFAQKYMERLDYYVYCNV